MAMKLYHHANKRGFAEKIRILLAETGIVSRGRGGSEGMDNVKVSHD